MSRPESDNAAYVYGDFRLGVLVPPANPTVEPEMTRLLPAEIIPYFARLPGVIELGSTSIGLRDRIDGYISSLSQVAKAFGGMGLDAISLAHTGISYVVGRNNEKNLWADLAQSGANHMYLATDAIRTVLQQSGVTRLGLISPYPTWLEDLALEYWTSDGLTVSVESLRDQPSIYDVGPATVRMAVQQVLGSAEVDAVLLSGTGLPTLAVLSETIAGGTPIISSNSCLAWYAAHILGGVYPSPPQILSAVDRWVSLKAP